MHLKKHLFFIFTILIVLSLLYFYSLSDMFHPKQIASYENFTEISEEFDASKEIEEAARRFPVTNAPAGIIKGNARVEGNYIALTFDGMDSRGNTETILQIVTDEGWHATFFVEGLNAAKNSATVQKLLQAEQLIGNYSFVGISKAEQMKPPALIEQFCRTQKVLKLITGTEPRLFKLQDTRYLNELLRAAKACGLENAVQSDISMPVSGLHDDGAIQQFVNRIRPGMIVSLQMGRPVPVRYVRKSEPGAPEIDKQPTIKDKNVAEVKNTTDTDSIKKLCQALKAKGFQVVTVNALDAMNKPDQKQ